MNRPNFVIFEYCLQFFQSFSIELSILPPFAISFHCSYLIQVWDSLKRFCRILIYNFKFECWCVLIAHWVIFYLILYQIFVGKELFLLILIVDTNVKLTHFMKTESTSWLFSDNPWNQSKFACLEIFLHLLIISVQFWSLQLSKWSISFSGRLPF